MPTVRTYGESKVAPAALPGVRATAAETPESEGSQLDLERGKAFQALGGGVAKFGATALEEVDRAKKQADNLANLNAENQLQSWTNDRLYTSPNAALKVQGNSAFGLPEAVGSEFDDQADKISAGLNNDEQRLAFEKARLEQRQGLQLTLHRHVFGEMQKYEANELASSVDNHTQSAIANAMDPRRVSTELDTIVGNIKQHAPNLGMGPEQTKQAVIDATSKVHVGVIEQMLAMEQDQAAKVYFEETQHQIKGDQIARIEKALEESGLRKQSQDVTDTIMRGSQGVRGTGQEKGEGFLGGLKRLDVPGSFSSEISIGVTIDGKNMDIPTMVPTLTKDEVTWLLSHDLENKADTIPTPIIAKAIAFARDRIAAGKPVFAQKGEAAAEAPAGLERATPEQPGPPSLSQALEQARAITDPKLRDQVETRIEHRFAQDKQAQLAKTEAAMTDASNRLDSSKGDLTTIPSTAWVSFSPAEKSALTSYAEKLRKGEEINTDWPTYYGAMQRASTDPTTFAQENLLTLRGKLGNSEFKQLAEIQASIREKKPPHPDVLEFRTKDQILDDTLARYGIETRPSQQSKGEIQAVAQIRRMLDQNLLTLSGLKGAKPDNTDIQKTLDGIMGLSKDTQGSWRALIPGSGVPLSDFRGSSKRAVDLTYNDIPAAEIPELKKSLVKKQRPVNEQTILDLYVDALQREAAQKAAAAKAAAK